MNYSSQLKGWAVDRATAIRAINKVEITVQDVISDAQALVDFCYSVAEDKDDLLNRVAQIEHDESMAAAMAMKPASNKEAN